MRDPRIRATPPGDEVVHDPEPRPASQPPAEGGGASTSSGRTREPPRASGGGVVRDAGHDAAHDAGHDAGRDAGHDAGKDASKDGGQALLGRALFEPPKRPYAAWLRILLTVLGVILVIAGIALGPIPVIPGFPLVIAGALMLSASNGTARRGMNWLERLLPESSRIRIRRLLRRQPPSATADATTEATTEATKQAPPPA